MTSPYLPYENGRTSPVHRAPPFLKVLLASFMGPLILISPAPLPLAAMSLLLLGILLLAKGRFRDLLHALRPASPLLAAILALHSIQGSSTEGLWVVWRFLLVLSISFLLLFTTPSREIARVMERILRPLPLGRLGLSSRDLSLMFVLTLRFLPLLQTEGERLRKAQRIRGFVPKRAGLRRGTKVLYGYSLAVLMGMIRRAEEVAKALQARGYGPGQPRPRAER